MANPWAGEVGLVINGKHRRLKLTLGALAELEQALGCRSLLELAQRFEQASYSGRDVIHVIQAGLMGAGEPLPQDEVLSADIGGGPVVAAQAAAQLLVRAFSVPADT